MAEFLFRLPDIGEGIAEAEIVAWHIAPGDVVAEDAPIADVMTDKATVEMAAPVTGKVLRLGGAVGERIAIGSLLATFDVEAAETVVSDATKGSFANGTSAQDEPQRTQTGTARGEEEGSGGDTSSPVSPDNHALPLPTSSPAPACAAEAATRVLASPAVRARATELGIDLAQVSPNGQRIRHGDLDAYLAYRACEGYHAPGALRARADESLKVAGIRRRIADNMAASKRHIPHFSYVEEIDVTSLEATRADLNARRGERPKLTVLPFLIAAVCKAVLEFPMINARYDDGTGIVTRHGAIHLGIATQTPAGLMVPVLRDAQDKNIWQLASEIARLAEAARRGTARSDELSGSTLTLSSLGALGGIAATPVINRPEVAILAPGRIVERPVVRSGEIRIAQCMNLSISCDHRVVDGWDAASFVQTLKTLIETPVLLFAP